MIKRPIITSRSGTNGSKDQICRLIVHPAAGEKYAVHIIAAIATNIVAAIERYAVSGDLNNLTALFVIANRSGERNSL